MCRLSQSAESALAAWVVGCVTYDFCPIGGDARSEEDCRCTGVRRPKSPHTRTRGVTTDEVFIALKRSRGRAVTKRARSPAGDIYIYYRFGERHFPVTPSARPRAETESIRVRFAACWNSEVIARAGRARDVSQTCVRRAWLTGRRVPRPYEFLLIYGP
jgi:hypothetical protein